MYVKNHSITWMCQASLYLDNRNLKFRCWRLILVLVRVDFNPGDRDPNSIVGRPWIEMQKMSVDNNLGVKSVRRFVRVCGSSYWKNERTLLKVLSNSVSRNPRRRRMVVLLLRCVEQR